LVDEVFKILHFNNVDPQTFTISFWADHFNIAPATLRNILNYVAYPLVDVDTKKVTKVLYFIDSELQKQQYELLAAGINREKYLHYLEADYSKRMVEDYGGEQGLFGRVEPTMSLSQQILATGQLERIIGNDITAMISDQSVINNIDKEIHEITSSQANRDAKSKNLKASK